MTEPMPVTQTASVHTVQIGNKQVSFSTYRQLDYVDALELNIWGRVRTGRCKPEEYELIGVDNFGVLSASLLREPKGIYVASPRDPDLHDTLRVGVGDDDTRKAVWSHGQQLFVHVWANEMAADPERLQAITDNLVDWWRQRVALYESAPSLPLVVLAGLR